MAKSNYYQSIVNSWVSAISENHIRKFSRVVNGNGNVFQDCKILGIAADLAQEYDLDFYVFVKSIRSNSVQAYLFQNGSI